MGERTARSFSGAWPEVRRLDVWPDPLDLHGADPRRYPHLLESSVGGTHARWDILFAFPADTVEAKDRAFLDVLSAWYEKERLSRGGLPFLGGWFLYLSYEFAGCLEPRLSLPQGEFPLALATRFPAALLRDRKERVTYLVAEHPSLLRAMEKDIASSPAHEGGGRVELRESPQEPFLRGIEAIHGYIRAGDIYQVNLSRPWRGRARGSPAALYAKLRRANPAPFSGLASWGEKAILATSPERLVKVEGRRVETRPIAGTYPRVGQDACQRNALIAHPKERAEHIMLIDLERNDLGKVCRPGTVRVDELLALETYASVHHLVSNVSGELREEATPGEVIRAVFPGGTITGCPKVRSMEIIAELEREPRGPYTGSMGYLSRDGRMDLNILIRTLVLDGERAELRAGAGIVADSIAGRELEETRAKAQGVIRGCTDRR